MTDKSIFRVHREDGKFFIMAKAIVNDESISWKAKGMLAYLLSKSDDWQVYVTDITNHGKDGIDAVNTGIKELESAGYIIRHQLRESGGQFMGYEYHVYETPAVSGLSTNGKPENGLSENGESKTTKNKKTKNKTINNKVTKIKEEEETPFKLWESVTGQLIVPYIADELKLAIIEWNERKVRYTKTKNTDGEHAVMEAIKVMGDNGARSTKYLDKILFSGDTPWIINGIGFEATRTKRQKSKAAKDPDRQSYVDNEFSEFIES